MYSKSYSTLALIPASTAATFRARKFPTYRGSTIRVLLLNALEN